MVLRRSGPGTVSINVGVEVVINLLAPSAPDRYFQSGGKQFPLRWGAAVPAVDLSVVDRWQQISAQIEAPGAHTFWIAPIETVSESEEGFERIYQGSQVIAVWPIELAAGAEWKAQVALRLEHLSNQPERSEAIRVTGW
jgi:alpha-amylase